MSLKQNLKHLARMLADEDHSDHEGEEHSDHEDHDDHAAGDGHDEHKDEHSEDDLETLKIVMMFAMFVCVGFGIIPKIWGKCRDNEQILSYLNCFSAGLFLGMALVHMMPEASEIYLSWAAEEKIEKPFPLPYVMYFVGYVLILSIDRVIA